MEIWGPFEWPNKWVTSTGHPVGPVDYFLGGCQVSYKQGVWKIYIATLRSPDKG